MQFAPCSLEDVVDATTTAFNALPQQSKENVEELALRQVLVLNGVPSDRHQVMIDAVKRRHGQQSFEMKLHNLCGAMMTYQFTQYLNLGDLDTIPSSIAFRKSSGNCLNGVGDYQPRDQDPTVRNQVSSVPAFFKIQLFNLGDPLMYEALLTKYLNWYESESPMYENEYRYRPLRDNPTQMERYREKLPNVVLQYIDSYVGVLDTKPWLVLVSELVQIKFDLLSFLYKKTARSYAPYSVTMSSLMGSALIAKLGKFLRQYIRFGSKLGFTHNDMHLSNIVFVEEPAPTVGNGSDNGSDNDSDSDADPILRCQMIDLGRSSVMMINQKEYRRIAEEVAYDFKVEPATMLSYIETDPSLKTFKITHELGFWADIATVTHNILAAMPDFVYPPWCQKIEKNNSTWLSIMDLNNLNGFDINNYCKDIVNTWRSQPQNSNFTYLSMEISLKPFVLGLAFICMALRAYFNIPEGTAFVFPFDRIKSSILCANGVFFPQAFDMCTLDAYFVNSWWNFLHDQKINLQNGGKARKNIVVKKAKAKLAKKMKGGQNEAVLWYQGSKEPYDAPGSASFGTAEPSAEQLQQAQAQEVDKFKDIDKPTSTLILERLVYILEKKSEIDGNKTDGPSILVAAGLKDNNQPDLGPSLSKFVNTAGSSMPLFMKQIDVGDPKPCKGATNANGSCRPNIPVEFPCAQMAAAAGGGGAGSKKVYQESKTGRKYVRLDGGRWYLDEHRGSYRYTNEKREKVRILGK